MKLNAQQLLQKSTFTITPSSGSPERQVLMSIFAVSLPFKGCCVDSEYSLRDPHIYIVQKLKNYRKNQRLLPPV